MTFIRVLIDFLYGSLLTFVRVLKFSKGLYTKLIRIRVLNFSGSPIISKGTQVTDFNFSQP